MTHLAYTLHLTRQHNAAVRRGDTREAMILRERIDYLDAKGGFVRRPNCEPVLQPGQMVSTASFRGVHGQRTIGTRRKWRKAAAPVVEETQIDEGELWALSFELARGDLDRRVG